MSRIFKAITAIAVLLAVTTTNVSGAVAEERHRQTVVAQATTHLTKIIAESSNRHELIAQATTLAPSGSRIILTNAQSNEGVIRIVTRICGDANNWRSVAADNVVKPPVYLVLLDQLMSVNCESSTTPDAVPQPAPQPAAAPAPQAPAAAPAAVSSGWTTPLAGYCFNGGDSGFRTGARPSHDGVDVGAAFGTPIRAAAAGTVSTSWDDGAGNYTVIDHGGGVGTVYMHQTSYERTSGWVNAGDIIGYVGSTGNSSGPHLHFEVHTGGIWYGKVNPMSWLSDHGVNFWC